MGSPLPTGSLWTLHQNVMFGGISFGTIAISLRPSCRSSIKRQGISLTSVTSLFRYLPSHDGGYSFLSISVYRYTGRTISSLFSVWHIVSEDSRNLLICRFIFEARLAISFNPSLFRCCFLFINFNYL